MAGLAKSRRDCRTTVIRVANEKEFVKQFNQDIPSKEFFDSCKKAANLFNVREPIRNVHYYKQNHSF